MNREIKFRFWEDGEQRDQNELAVYDGGVYCHNTGNTYRNNEIIAEQYTGLTDKNGVDIYEGDIVFGTWTSSDEEKTERLLVECIDGCFCPFFEPTGCTSGMLYTTSIYPENFEVIGNIHEHKHLLED